jgi:hypothetical protein
VYDPRRSVEDCANAVAGEARGYMIFERLAAEKFVDGGADPFERLAGTTCCDPGLKSSVRRLHEMMYLLILGNCSIEV